MLDPRWALYRAKMNRKRVCRANPMTEEGYCYPADQTAAEHGGYCRYSKHGTKFFTL